MRCFLRHEFIKRKSNELSIKLFVHLFYLFKSMIPIFSYYKEQSYLVKLDFSNKIIVTKEQLFGISIIKLMWDLINIRTEQCYKN